MRKGHIDIILGATFIGLVIFGIAMISSVSVYESYELTKNNVSPTNSFYLWRHFSRAMISFVAFGFGIYIPLIIWKKIALPLFAVSILLLIALFMPGVGAEYGTAHSWINIPFLPSIQPSEFVKLALIFYLALWMDKKQEMVRSLQFGFAPFTVILSAIVFLLALQPDFGSVLVISTIAASMFFGAKGNIIHIFVGGLLASGIAYPVIMSNDYIKKRFLAFLNPEIDPLGIGFQIKQSLIAIGSGGFFGVGFGKSIQKFGYLPEVQGDTIFAATAEELGFFRMSLLIGAYMIIAYRGYMIARNAKDRFSMLVAIGITSWFTFQAMINMGVNLALLPLTGLTLPFISYGGTSLIVNMLGAGILLNISRNVTSTPSITRRRGLRRSHHPKSRYRYGA